MNIAELQAKIGAKPDGVWGPISKATLLQAFTNKEANAVSFSEIEALAARLGCTRQQLRAVAEVESSGSGFDSEGRPKILFERHYFHRLTKGRWTPAAFSQPRGGGYIENSWTKLADACGFDPDAAFSSCSYGKFQVMGAHWAALGYPSPFALAWSTVQSEGDHYELLARFIEANHLQDEMRALSANPDDCREFARRYNGPAYEKGQYHAKLAKELRGK